MAASDETNDSLPHQAPGDECALCEAIRLPPGDRSLAGTTQEGGDFMFAELTGVDLTAADFYWALFHNAILEKAVLARCDLRGAIFNEAQTCATPIFPALIAGSTISGDRPISLRLTCRALSFATPISVAPTSPAHA